ncbi:unnamed protein product [Caenorhabditis brenneri]
METRIEITADDKFISQLERRAEPLERHFVLCRIEKNSKFPVDQVENGFQPRRVRLWPTQENLTRWNDIPTLPYCLKHRFLQSIKNKIFTGPEYAVEEAETGILFSIEKFRILLDGSLMVTFPVVQNREYNAMWVERVERELRSKDREIELLREEVRHLQRIQSPAEQVELN